MDFTKRRLTIDKQLQKRPISEGSFVFASMKNDKVWGVAPMPGCTACATASPVWPTICICRSGSPWRSAAGRTPGPCTRSTPTSLRATSSGIRLPWATSTGRSPKRKRLSKTVSINLLFFRFFYSEIEIRFLKQNNRKSPQSIEMQEKTSEPLKFRGFSFGSG